jgi:DNA-binding transcriptional ArsR family regulator
MLSALLDGRALTATELAYAARITAQTASTHLAKLTEAGLISPIKDGRYRYFRLASPKVAQMLDGIMAVALEDRPRSRPHRDKRESFSRPGFATTIWPVVSASTWPIFSLRADTS